MICNAHPDVLLTPHEPDHGPVTVDQPLGPVRQVLHKNLINCQAQVNLKSICIYIFTISMTTFRDNVTKKQVLWTFSQLCDCPRQRENISHMGFILYLVAITGDFVIGEFRSPNLIDR